MTDSPRRPEIETLEPVAGFTPGIGHYVAQLQRTRAELLRQVEHLTPAQLSWHPNDTIESIGTQMLHVAAVEWSWIYGDILGGSPDNDYPGSWKEAAPIQLGVPQVSGKPLAYFTDRLQQDRDAILAALNGLTDTDLPRMITDEESGDQFSVDWILFHLVEHEAHHAAQVELLRRLLPADL